MLKAFWGRFYREILIILNIIFVPVWTFTPNPDPLWWQTVLFIIGLSLEFFTLFVILYHFDEVDLTWRQKWKNFCKFSKRSCKQCNFGKCCKHSNCQHKSLKDSKYYLLKFLGY